GGADDGGGEGRAAAAVRGAVRERALAALVGDEAHAVDQDAPGLPGRRDDDLVPDRLVLLARVEDDPALAPAHAAVGGAREERGAAEGDAVDEGAGIGVLLG